MADSGSVPSVSRHVECTPTHQDHLGTRFCEGRGDGGVDRKMVSVDRVSGQRPVRGPRGWAVMILNVYPDEAAVHISSIKH